MAWVGEYLKTNLIIMLQPPATSSQMTSTQMTMTTFQPGLKEISMAEVGELTVLLLEKDLGNEAIGHTVPWSTSKNYFLFSSLSEQTNNLYSPKFSIATSLWIILYYLETT